MLLVSAKVGPFKSIETPQVVELQSDVTVLVGMNEAGKTVFLNALQKARDALKRETYIPLDDYPRKNYTAYKKRHEKSPENVATLLYALTAEELADAQSSTGIQIPDEFRLTMYHRYDNTFLIGLTIDEGETVAAIAASLSSDAGAALEGVRTVRKAVAALTDAKLTDDDKAIAAAIAARVAAAPSSWESVLSNEVWKYLQPRLPAFAYFGEYEILPSKVNIRTLSARAATPAQLTPEDRTVMALLRMADLTLSEIAQATSYEAMRANLEAVSIDLTSKVMAFWKANESNLEAVIDIRDDALDEPPFNNGPNLYLRIRNLRHQGMTTPFRQRSRGFVWFFSFLVWFESVQEQLGLNKQEGASPAVLLLDEPGLNLHALAQRDFLAYIDELAKVHQVIYTTHSPFMVRSDRLDRVRVVEDKQAEGTVISANIASSNERTLFPLQAALGYTIAQNLFISERNLIVEGPSELLYLQTISALIERNGGAGLRSDVTIVPADGLSNVVTFVSLLNASGLKLVVLHDYDGNPDQRLSALARDKLISAKAILNVSQFRDVAALGRNGIASDIEDLLPVSMYLDYFNRTFAKQLAGQKLSEADLPERPRVTRRLDAALEAKGIKIRPTGGFNHYTVAMGFVSAPPLDLDNTTVASFSALFTAINALF